MPSKCRDTSSYTDSCICRIDNKLIELVNSFSLLGHLITSSLRGYRQASRWLNFIGQVNNVICYFSKLNSFVRFNLFRSYCTSFYGCKLWLLDKHCIDDLGWMKGLTKIWNIPPQTHREQLFTFARGHLSVLSQICMHMFISWFELHSLCGGTWYLAWQRIFVPRAECFILHESLQ